MDQTGRSWQCHVWCLEGLQTARHYFCQAGSAIRISRKHSVDCPQPSNTWLQMGSDLYDPPIPRPNQGRMVNRRLRDVRLLHQVSTGRRSGDLGRYPCIRIPWKSIAYQRWIHLSDHAIHREYLSMHQP